MPTLADGIKCISQLFYSVIHFDWLNFRHTYLLLR